MTIEQRQADAENWADAYADWLAADEQAHHYDQLRINSQIRLDAARERLASSATVGTGHPFPPTRVFIMPVAERPWQEPRKLVKVTYHNPGLVVELLTVEPSGDNWAQPSD